MTTHIQIDMATLWLNHPIGANSVKIVCLVPVWLLRVCFQQIGPWAYYIYKSRCPRLDLAVFPFLAKHLRNLPLGQFFLKVLMSVARVGCLSVCPLPMYFFFKFAHWSLFSTSCDVHSGIWLCVCVSPSLSILFEVISGFSRPGPSRGLLFQHPCHSLTNCWLSHPWVKISLRRRHVQTVKNGASCHKTNYIDIFLEISNLEAHQSLRLHQACFPRGQGSICATPEGPTHSEKRRFMYCRRGVDLHFHMVVKKELFVLTTRISLQPNFSQKSKLLNQISLPVFSIGIFPNCLEPQVFIPEQLSK